MNRSGDLDEAAVLRRGLAELKGRVERLEELVSRLVHDLPPDRQKA